MAEDAAVPPTPPPIPVPEPRSPTEAVALLGAGTAPAALGPLVGRPALVVALDGSGPRERRDLAACTRHAPCVVIGLLADEPGTLSAEEADAFDVLLHPAALPPRPYVGAPEGPAAAAGRLLRAVDHSPDAAVALVQLLRASTGLPIDDAIACESFVYSMLQSGDHFRRWLAERGELAHRPGIGPPVLLDRSDDLLVVELNRPHVRNAVDRGLRDGLIEAFGLALADSTIRRIHVSGRGPSFSSGGDLAEFGMAPDPVTAHAVRVARSAGSWLARCADRTTVEVHGTCMGAGVELAAFAGRVRAAPDTTCALPEVAMGLVPGAGGTVSIPRRVGRQRAAYLALSGERLGVETGLHWGLLDEIDDTAGASRDPSGPGGLSGRRP